MSPVFVESVGLAAPGLAGWAASRPILRGEAVFAAAELPVYLPRSLPPNERRRATAAVRLAFCAAEDAIDAMSEPAGELATVFATSDADTNIIHRICAALAEPQRAISPTDFHNSVHNAAAGYWSIATGVRATSISLSAWDASYAAGLLEAASLVRAEDCRVLLVAYDVPAPVPLRDRRGISTAFGVAMVLGSRCTRTCIAGLEPALASADETSMEEAALESLRLSNPAGRALPLLERLARRREGRVVLPAAGARSLAIDVFMTGSPP
ncbi:MAG: beta-ketoacyl synthase chain length factor [Panacagrimonas sp.]